MCEQVEEKLESGQGKSTTRRFFARFCTPIFLEVSYLKEVYQMLLLILYELVHKKCVESCFVPAICDSLWDTLDLTLYSGCRLSS